MTNFVVAAYYTEGTGYAVEAEKLRASLNRFGISHQIVAVPNRGSWQKNTQFKAYFILEMLEQSLREILDRRPYIFVDADAIFHAYPELFDTLDADAAFAWRDYSKFPSMSSKTRRELLSGTIFLQNNEAVRELVREWIAENEKNPTAWEQRNLQAVVERSGTKLRIAELPPTYCKIFDIMRDAGPAVIEHYQKSRVYRRQVDGRSVPFGPGPFGEAFVRQVNLIVPTRNRAEKLERMLASVPRKAAGKTIYVIVISDGDFETPKIFQNNKRIDLLEFTEEQIGSVAARNRITPLCQDAVLMATDDIVFESGAIDAAVRAMEERFPDGDGVVGFVQTNHKSYSATGVCLVGQKFLRRYPGKQLYFPGYFHFACQEIERLARSLDKLYVEPLARLFHAHPSTGDGKVDRTHIEARRHKAEDQALSKARREAGLTWGAA